MIDVNEVMCAMLCQPDSELTTLGKAIYKQISTKWNQLPIADRELIISKVQESLIDVNPEAWCYDNVTDGLKRYDETSEKPQTWPKIIKIIVDNEDSKQQLLKASEYIHNLYTINSDFMMVNTLMHLYMAPDLIEVQHG